MRKIPLPDENRRRSERLTDEKPAVNVLRKEQTPSLRRKTGISEEKTGGQIPSMRRKTELSAEGSGYGFDTFSGTDDGEDLIKKSAKKSAREYALLLVSTHTYTEKALFQKIVSKKTYTHEEITDAVEYVKKFGYVNDKRLAENMIPKLAERCFGRSKICRYFASKGISDDVIDELDFSEIDFVYYCKRLLDRQTGKPHEKIMRTLLNAGYTYDEIAEAKGLSD